MRIEFSVKTTCDFKTATHGDTFEILFQAFDEENSEQYSKYFSMAKRGDSGLVGFLVALFESAFKIYGTHDYTSWGVGCVPDRFHAAADVPATLKKYRAYKAPRKRRYGYVCLEAETDWRHTLPYEPVVYRNPAQNRERYLMSQMYFANEFDSMSDYVKDSIEEGYAASVESMRFYQKMAGIYEKKTGDSVNLVA